MSVRDQDRRRQERPPTTRRDCLRCERAFDSEGAHHRMCTDCRAFLDHTPTEVPRGRLRGFRERPSALP
jgi:hypothetical protein